ncbi:hypothetical protein KKF91_20420 [Myxococcota bacterium]|nr:hypothetical protein [Myxococcota bacterium]MBU1432912.1 hypothetical protein [Myxococcota bacterium]MBU1900539.1 hypothetical protein [Myxococcota bacterium]
MCTCALWGCVSESPVIARERRSLAAQAVVLDARTQVRVQGAVITHHQIGPPHRVFIRASSLDLRVDVIDEGCAPSVIELEVDQLITPALTSHRTFRAALAPRVIAARAASEGALGWQGDVHDPSWTALDEEAIFQAARADKRARWSVRLDRSQETAQVAKGHGVFGVEASTPGACATLDTETGGLGRAALVLRHRLRLDPKALDEAPLRFAVWGNSAENTKQRDALIAQLNADPNLRFLILGGDLLAAGEPEALAVELAALAALNVPLFATLGERDVLKDAPLLAGLGPATLAFDAGAARIILLDSADATLAPDTYTRLDAWLSDASLWWQQPAPPLRLVITHTPPFDLFGSRGAGFKHRPEAGRLLALLSRARISGLLTFHLATWATRRRGEVTVYHAGGGGAPLEGGGDDHFYLQVSLLGGCAPRGQVGGVAGAACDAQAPCGEGLSCQAARCVACAQIERVSLSTPID